MTRKIICFEGVEKVPGNLFEVNSLVWDDGPTPVVWNFDFVNISNLIGHADDFRREDDGSITAEIHLNPRYQKMKLGKEISYTVYVKEITEKREGGFRHVKHGRIKAVSGVISGTVPW